MSKTIYLDNAATTQVADEVLKEMEPYFNDKFGNASSVHFLGQEARRDVESARAKIAKSINASKDEIIFTSGGTESNNLAIKGVAFAKGKGHIITSKIEHDCVLNSCKWLKKQGFEITYLDVNSEGFVKLDKLEKAIKKDTILVSIIHGNNEIGTIQDLEAIGGICKKHNIYFHTDACQSYTKTELDVKKMNLSLVTLNAHKIHGPKGVGALYIKQGTKIIPWQDGGGQEFNMRSGTENVPGIVGFAKASGLISQKDIGKMENIRNKLIDGVLTNIKGVRLNGPRENRLCNNINFSFQGVEGEAIGTYLNSYNICSSTGSACSSKSLEPSHVLKAIGLSDEQAHGSLRLSLSKYTTEEEIDRVLEVLPIIITKLRKISPFQKIVEMLPK